MIAQIAVSSSAVRVAQIGPACKLLVIQNNGAVNVRLSFDGNTDNTYGPDNTLGGSAPTTTKGYRLAAGQQWVQTFAQFPAMGNRSIWAISEGASVNLDVISDDKDTKVG
jgi:hypothetical protein